MAKVAPSYFVSLRHSTPHHTTTTCFPPPQNPSSHIHLGKTFGTDCDPEQGLPGAVVEMGDEEGMPVSYDG